MIKPILTIRERAGSFSVVAHAGEPGEFIAASRIREQFIAKQFSAAPELIDAAVFAASVIKCHGMFDLSEKLAYQKLEQALAIAGVEVDTFAIRECAERRAALDSTSASTGGGMKAAS